MLKQIMLATSIAFTSHIALANNTIIEMNTSLGLIEIELYNDKAPISAKNFENYVKANFYKDTIFHRVIPKFMVQGGGFNSDMMEKENKNATIRNESNNGLSNKRGTLAMARTNDPHSARSQFFINLEDNEFLDRSTMNAGYAVFGEVKTGMEVVDNMAKVPTGRYQMHQNVPNTAIKILSVNIKEALVQNKP